MISRLAISSIVLLLVQAGKCPFGYGGSSQQKAVQLNNHKPSETNLLQAGFGGGGFGSGGNSRSFGTGTTTIGASGTDVSPVNSEPAASEVTPTSTIDFSTIHYPSEILTCEGKNKVMGTIDFTQELYRDFFQDMSTLYESRPREDKAGFAACLVRLAGHDFMDYRLGANGAQDATGGSDGCVNFQDPDNKGLAQCLHFNEIQPLYHKWCDRLSLADFIVIAAETITARVATDYNVTDPFVNGTLASRFMQQLHVGRQTLERCPRNLGLMPNPENGCMGLQHIFIDHIFKEKWNKRKAWKMVAAISGAHTLGQARLENSGYNGHWSDPEDQGIFNNGYYKNMLKRGWGPEKNISGNPEKNQWQRVDQLPCDQDFHELMLNTDLCLAYQFNQIHIDCMRENNRNVGRCNKHQRKGEFLTAHNQTCCAWLNQRILFEERRGPVLEVDNNDFCGINAADTSHTAYRGICCQHEPSGDDCDAMNWPKGIAFDEILLFAGKEHEFFNSYLEAWKRATENGFPKPLGPLGQ